MITIICLMFAFANIAYVDSANSLMAVEDSFWKQIG